MFNEEGVRSDQSSSRSCRFTTASRAPGTHMHDSGWTPRPVCMWWRREKIALVTELFRIAICNPNWFVYIDSCYVRKIGVTGYSQKIFLLLFTFGGKHDRCYKNGENIFWYNFNFYSDSTLNCSVICFILHWTCDSWIRNAVKGIHTFLRLRKF